MPKLYLVGATEADVMSRWPTAQRVDQASFGCS